MATRQFVSSRQFTPFITWWVPSLGASWGQWDSGIIPATTTDQWRFPRYCKDASGVVHLTGLVKNVSGGNVTGNNTIFTLPVGFRPAHKQRFPSVYGVNGDSFYDIDIDFNGIVMTGGSSGVAPNGTWVSLNGISFVAEL